MRRHNALKILVLLILIAAVVPPAIFGTPRAIEGAAGGDPWRNVIFDFQTLIGGLFAVFAAWWTVDTMERTDRAAQKRHEHLMAQQTRPDALKVERYIKTEFPKLADAVRVLDANRIPIGATVDEMLANCVERARAAEGCLNSATSFHIQTNWKACAPLFGGNLEHDWQVFETAATGASKAASAVRFYVRPTYEQIHQSKDRDKVLQRDAEARLLIESLPIQLDAAIEALKKVEVHMRELGRIYGVNNID